MLVALDFDGALVTSDPFVRLGEQQGVGEDVAALGERAANGDLGYEESLRSRADLLAGLPDSQVREAFEHVERRRAADDVLRDLHAAGHHVAVITDAPERAVERHLDPVSFDVDTVIANRLPERNDALTGEIEGPIVGREKDEPLKELAAAEGFDLAETMAVADDVRDLPMLQAAGEAIGIDPAPDVRPHCDTTVETMDDLHLRFSERGVFEGDASR